MPTFVVATKCICDNKCILLTQCIFSLAHPIHLGKPHLPASDSSPTDLLSVDRQMQIQRRMCVRGLFLPTAQFGPLVSVTTSFESEKCVRPAPCPRPSAPSGQAPVLFKERGHDIFAFEEAPSTLFQSRVQGSRFVVVFWSCEEGHSPAPIHHTSAGGRAQQGPIQV